LLLRPMGNCLYVMPPYCVSEAQIGRIGDVVIEVLDSL
jgi:adenosylmethionine-8-amino-7-oxononanoate aminotransferase